MCVCVCVCTCMSIYVHTCTCMCVRVCACVRAVVGHITMSMLEQGFSFLKPNFNIVNIGKSWYFRLIYKSGAEHFSRTYLSF